MNNPVHIVSSDLNGTLVHQHTMMDMIRYAFPNEPERYEKAKTAFEMQTSGKMSMADAFKIAGPLTRGLSLKNAIEYTLNVMRPVNGFHTFLDTLKEKGIFFVINSTGYTVTTETIRMMFGKEKIGAVICNRLLFSMDSMPGKTLSEKELSLLVERYFRNDRTDPVFDHVRATGEIELVIRDENEKAVKLFSLAAKMGISRNRLCHIGDTMGDSGGIVETAGNGGIGIAFNYNPALKRYLETLPHRNEIPGEIILVDAKSETSDLRHLCPYF